jgi:hypothetical protein
MTDRRNLLLTVAVVLGLLPMAGAEIERWNWRGLKRPWRRPVQVFFLKCLLKERTQRTYTTKRLWGGQRSHTAACQIEATCFTCAWGAMATIPQ